MLQHEGIIGTVVVVLTLTVPPQVDLALEGLFAEAAGERFVSRVLPHVGDQVGALAERFRANNALVGLFTWRENRKRRKRDSGSEIHSSSDIMSG